MYGPFSQEEIEYYRKRLTKDGSPVMNSLQTQLIGYMFYSEFGDPITMKAIKNQTDYIKLLIAAKRILRDHWSMIILPYVISSRVLRTASRKIISKKDTIRIENSEDYAKIRTKYNNPKMEQKVIELIGTIMSSTFELIEWDEKTHGPGEFDGAKVPMINDLLISELITFIARI